MWVPEWVAQSVSARRPRARSTAASGALSGCPPPTAAAAATATGVAVIEGLHLYLSRIAFVTKGNHSSFMIDMIVALVFGLSGGEYVRW